MPQDNRGGKKRGAGRPSNYELRQKQRDAVTADVQALAVEALPEVFALYRQILNDPEQEMGLRMKAAQFLTEHGLGKPAVKAPNQESGEITFVALVPRPGRGQEGERDGEEAEDGGSELGSGGNEEAA